MSSRGPYKAAPLRSVTEEHPARTGFHGSPHGLIGEVITPMIGAGRKQYGMSSSQHMNYFTSPTGEKSEQAEQHAWGWATMRDKPTSAQMRNDPSAGRPRVHQVQVEPEVSVGWDANLRDTVVNIGQALKRAAPVPMAAEKARVTNTIWIPPPMREVAEAGGGIQGTLPHINWNQFGATNTGNPEDTAVGGTGFDEMAGVRRRSAASKARDQAKLAAVDERIARRHPPQTEGQQALPFG